MAPRPDVSQERIPQILDAATRVFARLGFHQARMEDIAEESRLSKGTLYLYFKSKDDLIAALLRRIFGRELHEVRAMLTVDAPARDRILQITQQMTREAERLSILLPIWFEFYAVAARQRAVRQFLKNYLAEYRELFAALIQQGIARGEFRLVDPAEMATTVIALYEGLVLVWALDPDTVQIGKVGASAVEVFLDGLRPVA